MLVLYIFSTLKIARVLVYTRTCRLAHTAHAYDSNYVFFSLTQNSGFFCIPWVSEYHDEGMFVWSSLCTFKNHDFWSTCTHVHARKLLMIINVTYIDARCSTPSHACYWPALSGTVVCIGAVCSFLTYFQTCVCWRHACVCTCMYVVGISAHTFVMMMQVCRPLFLLLHFVCTCLILNFVCMWSQRIVHAAEHEVYWPSVCCFTGLQMCLRTPSSLVQHGSCYGCCHAVHLGKQWEEKLGPHEVPCWEQKLKWEHKLNTLAFSRLQDIVYMYVHICLLSMIL